MAQYLLTDTENNTWRGHRVCPGSSVFSVRTEDNIFAKNAEEIGDSPLVAIMLNPWHAQLDEQKMLELQFSQIGLVSNDPHVSMMVREIPAPPVTTDQKIVFALMVVREVYGNASFNEWAGGWISGSNRSPEAAGKMFAQLGRIARETNEAAGSLEAMGVRPAELQTIDVEKNDFCARASEALFAAQMYMDRPENWPLLASRSVSRAIAGLGKRADLVAIAEKAIASSTHTVMRTKTAA